MCLLQAPRGENRGYTGETRARGTKVNTIFQVTRNGRTIEAEDGGSDAGEEAQPGTQGNHITSRIIQILSFGFIPLHTLYIITFPGVTEICAFRKALCIFLSICILSHTVLVCQISVELMISDHYR